MRRISSNSLSRPGQFPALPLHLVTAGDQRLALEAGLLGALTGTRGGRAAQQGGLAIAQGAELAAQPAEFAVLLPPGGIDDPGLRVVGGQTLYRQAVESELFPHVLEEVLLRPAREQRAGGLLAGQGEVGGDQGELPTIVQQPADLAHLGTLRQAHPLLGQAHLERARAPGSVQGQPGGPEVGLRPVGTPEVLVPGQHGDAPAGEPPEQGRTPAFPVEDQRQGRLGLRVGGQVHALWPNRSSAERMSCSSACVRRGSRSLCRHSSGSPPSALTQ